MRSSLQPVRCSPTARRLIWTDDAEVPRLGPLFDELTTDGRGLLIAPTPKYGLDRDHLDAIEAFAARRPV